MAKKYSLVLSDELQTEYYKFAQGENSDSETMKRLLHYYKAPFLTNVAQYNRTGVKIADKLRVQLIKSGFKNQSLEELARKTTLKVILTTDSDVFPYININGDKIENNLCGCFFRSEPRTKAIAHIKAICEYAKEICIYDKYFSAVNGIKNLQLLENILPQKQLSIVHDATHITSADVAHLKKHCPQWNFTATTLSAHHDRYLIVDGETEIILTSGFDHLANTTNEFTYILRVVSEQRFSMPTP